jgi:hypothetical protein
MRYDVNQVVLYFDRRDALRFTLAASSVMSAEGPLKGSSAALTNEEQRQQRPDPANVNSYSVFTKIWNPVQSALEHGMRVGDREKCLQNVLV